MRSEGLAQFVEVATGDAGGCTSDLRNAETLGDEANDALLGLEVSGHDLLLETGHQFSREFSGWYLLASARILARPQGREITAPLAFRFGAQGGDGRSG